MSDQWQVTSGEQEGLSAKSRGEGQAQGFERCSTFCVANSSLVTRHSSLAHGSLAELYPQLRMAVELDLCSDIAAAKSFGLIEELRKMLNALRRTLVTRH